MVRKTTMAQAVASVRHSVRKGFKPFAKTDNSDDQAPKKRAPTFTEECRALSSTSLQLSLERMEVQASRWIESYADRINVHGKLITLRGETIARKQLGTL